MENRKNLVLMVASFAFSILMFMSFSGLIDFMNHAIRPLRPWSPDISLISPDNSCSIDIGVYENCRPCRRRIRFTGACLIMKSLM